MTPNFGFLILIACVGVNLFVYYVSENPTQLVIAALCALAAIGVSFLGEE